MHKKHVVVTDLINFLFQRIMKFLYLFLVKLKKFKSNLHQNRTNDTRDLFLENVS